MALTVPCTPDEHRLIVGGATQLVVPGEPIVDWSDMGCAKIAAPQRWVDATGPCPTCDGDGFTVEGPNYHDPYGDKIECLECAGSGIKLVELRVRCSCTAMRCLLPCAEVGSVVFAHATVEILPVVDANDSYADHGLNHACLFDGITFIHHGKHYDELTFDPLPVPGRDWVVVLSNVEVTS